MANRGSAAVALVKWVGVPIALAALGFFLIGPRVANSYLQRTRSSEPPVQRDAPPAEDEPKRFEGEPKVEVSAQRVRSSSSNRRRRSSPPVRVEPAPEEQPEYNPEPSPEPTPDDSDGQPNG